MSGSRWVAWAIVGAVVVASCGADSGQRRPPVVAASTLPVSPRELREDTFQNPTRSTVPTTTDAPGATETSIPPATSEPVGGESATSEPVDGVPPGSDPADTASDGSSPPDDRAADPPAADPPAAADDPYPAVTKALARFTTGGAAADAVSITVIRDGDTIIQRAVGETHDGDQLETSSPMVVSGVSKLITALAVGRLAGEDLIDPAAPVPFDSLGLTTHKKWAPITVRDLIDQTSGMPAKNNLWKTSTDSCAVIAAELVRAKPVAKRVGKRTDANGNACVLGLLIEQVTGEPLADAVQRVVFDPVGVDGLHTTAGGLLDGDAGVIEDQQVVSTGGAGAFVVSTDALATAFSELADADVEVFGGTSVMKDQYGWGHTGISKGISSCLWVLEDGATVLAASVAGGGVKGAQACDRLVPALATDLELGLGSDKPDRNK